MKYYPLLVILIAMACSKENRHVAQKTDTFVLNYRDKGSFVYNNAECEFDNRSTQSQFTGTSTTTSGVPKAYFLFSTYENLNSQDSTLDQVWINLYVEYDSLHASFTTAYLEHLLQTENSHLNYNHLYPDVQVEVCGERFDNEDILTEAGESVYKLDENFIYHINDYEVLYESDCVMRSLLYLDITLEGMLYQHSFGDKHDSIYLEESNLKLFFDID